MKKSILLSCILLITLACDKDSLETSNQTIENIVEEVSDINSENPNETISDETPDDFVEPEETILQKFLKEINYTDKTDGPQKRIFFYSNNLLVREMKRGKLLHLYDYNSDNKIVSEVYCNDFGIPEDELENYECTDMVDSREFNFINDQLVSLISHTDGSLEGIIKYDDNGNLISLEYPGGGMENWYYTYDENNIVLTTTVTHYGEGNTYTYEFDGKQNPFYSLWASFGYKERFLRIDPYNSTGTFFKENPTKVYENNELLFEASYNYDSDGYPLTCSFIKYLSDGSTWSSVITFEYGQ